MSYSDRLFLEDACPTLQQRILEEPPQLAARLAEDRATHIQDQDFQDFEVGYSLSSEGQELRLRVIYPYLGEVWGRGSQTLLDRVFAGLPVRCAQPSGEGELLLSVDALALAEDEVARRRCAKLVASTRIWLLAGPLMERLLWLQGVSAGAGAGPGTAIAAIAAAAAAVRELPSPLHLQVRRLEDCWIVCKADRVLVVLSVHLEDEADVALGQAFCQEIADESTAQWINGKPRDFSMPCSFNEPKDLPHDVKGLLPSSMPNVGYLTLALSDQLVRGASEERLLALARPVMTWRNFFQFHLKHTKSYLHDQLRRRVGLMVEQLGKAKRKPKTSLRRLASGREFVPPARAPSPRTAPAS